jgi:hypothetical protein
VSQAMNGASWGAGHERCGALTRRGISCKLPAGHGTDHPGIGRCDHHGGATPTHRAHAERVLIERAEQDALAELHRLGVPPMTNPLEALSELAAEARQWETILRGRVAALESLSQMTPGGIEQVRAVVILFERAMDRAAALAAMCVKLDVDDRLVRLNARIGEEIAQAVVGVFERSLREMNLTPEQWRVAREVFPRELSAVADADE